MQTDSHEHDDMPLPAGLLEGRQALADALHAVLAVAAQRGWRELILADADFADWPLGERATIERLQNWAGAGRSLTLVAHDFAPVARQHARFVDWRRQWDHIICARACNGPGAPEVPSAIWTPGWCLHRLDVAHNRAVCGSGAAERAALRLQLDECVRHGRAAFPASTLGL